MPFRGLGWGAASLPCEKGLAAQQFGLLDANAARPTLPEPRPAQLPQAKGMSRRAHGRRKDLRKRPTRWSRCLPRMFGLRSLELLPSRTLWFPGRPRWQRLLRITRRMRRTYRRLNRRHLSVCGQRALGQIGLAVTQIRRTLVDLGCHLGVQDQFLAFARCDHLHLEPCCNLGCPYSAAKAFHFHDIGCTNLSIVQQMRGRGAPLGSSTT